MSAWLAFACTGRISAPVATATSTNCAACPAGLICADRGTCAEGGCPIGQCSTGCESPRQACDEPTGALCCPGGETCCGAAEHGYIDGDRCSSGGQCPLACPNGGACMAGQMCQYDPAAGADRCVANCGPDVGAPCGERVCCPLGSECKSDGTCPLPDLTYDLAATRESINIVEQDFGAGDCELAEDKMCVGGGGTRQLLEFSVMTVNLGPGDLTLASDHTPLFEYSQCHMHSHFKSFAKFDLVRRDDGSEVAPGRKMSFCILDMQAHEPGAPAQPRGADMMCRHLTAGWADVYAAGLSCQWIDITGVEPGDYTLRVTANPDRLLVEKSYDNNVLELPVTVPARGSR